MKKEMDQPPLKPALRPRKLDNAALMDKIRRLCHPTFLNQTISNVTFIADKPPT